MPRPIVWPNTQLFGIGFGQNGSTSNIGTCSRLRRSLVEHALDDAQRARTATNVAP